jgi:hypothetical protein
MTDTRHFLNPNFFIGRPTTFELDKQKQQQTKEFAAI